MRRVIDCCNLGRFAFLQLPHEPPKDVVSGISWLYTPFPVTDRPHHTDMNCNYTYSRPTISDIG